MSLYFYHFRTASCNTGRRLIIVYLMTAGWIVNVETEIVDFVNVVDDFIYSFRFC